MLTKVVTNPGSLTPLLIPQPATQRVCNLPPTATCALPSLSMEPHLERIAGGSATLYFRGLDLSYRPPSGLAAARMDALAFRVAWTAYGQGCAGSAMGGSKDDGGEGGCWWRGGFFRPSPYLPAGPFTAAPGLACLSPSLTKALPCLPAGPPFTCLSLLWTFRH